MQCGAAFVGEPEDGEPGNYRQTLPTHQSLQKETEGTMSVLIASVIDVMYLWFWWATWSATENDRSGQLLVRRMKITAAATAVMAPLGGLDLPILGQITGIALFVEWAGYFSIVWNWSDERLFHKNKRNTYAQLSENGVPALLGLDSVHRAYTASQTAGRSLVRSGQRLACRMGAITTATATPNKGGR